MDSVINSKVRNNSNILSCCSTYNLPSIITDAKSTSDWIHFLLEFDHSNTLMPIISFLFDPNDKGMQMHVSCYVKIHVTTSY
ncbi:MAG: hypothetical protein M3250_02845 [Thermoproteota archaeon]|nr:hypothetical protein [Thermoproteota archaeon]